MQRGARLVAVVGREHDAVVEDLGMGHGQGLVAGRHLDVGAGELELQVGEVGLDGHGRVGRGQVAVTPGFVVDAHAEAELEVFVGHEVAAQPQALPDGHAVLGLGPCLIPTGEIAVGEENAVDAGIAGHAHFRGGVRGGRCGRHEEQGGEKVPYSHTGCLPWVESYDMFYR
ncbi:hypothetical protein DSECCO2_651420 [anaerobic digester metagenome]